MNGCAVPLLAAALAVATVPHCTPGAHAMEPTVTIDPTPITLAERLEDAGIGYVDTPDGYEITASGRATIRVVPDGDGATVYVTRPDPSERDTGGYTEDEYTVYSHLAAVRTVEGLIDAYAW